MYILVLLIGTVNMYFILTTLIMLLGLFTEYVQVPLINFLSETLRLPIHYAVKRTLVLSNTNVFNIIFNQDYNNQDTDVKDTDDKNTESTDESDDATEPKESDDNTKPDESDDNTKPDESDDNTKPDESDDNTKPDESSTAPEHAPKESSGELEESSTENEDYEHISDDADETSSVPDLIDENELLYLQKSNAIIIDENLD